MNIKILLLFIISPWSVFAQNINRDQIKKYCGETDHCGPYDMIDAVIKILGEETLKSPYQQILHIETRRRYTFINKKPDWGTLSFISHNTLVTARHVVSNKAFLREIALSAPNKGEDDWITLKKNDFEVKYYEDGDADLAVIKILNSNKLRRLYKGSFFCISKLDTITMKEERLNLTGYPCYFANTPETKHDTLINKSVPVNRLQINNNFIAYQIFTRVGDSGAPLWMNQNGVNNIVGIHHGGKEGEDFDEDYNIAVKLDDKMIAWLNSVSKE
ncbi:trypsin-like serine peptidase [Chitinophaga ginsengisoli]|uniref:Serine protease n=1 Tax=Chitinophaga ginsengisoli TaxID=363837 RepID=A0A2P8FQS4_9BACT|nr:trypsin-like serine protease [Chitinophaga ginsengisoli]PSL24080.1 V8-like Glu-specific endopeptidase [Chitinophaga ginsengisoli]